jgi:hypothetical protein
LIETGICLAPSTGVADGDVASDASDVVADKTTSNDVARDVLYMLTNFHFNSDDVENSSSVGRVRYLACSDHRGRGR